MVKLTINKQGNYLVIEVADDGAGLNEDRILKKAIERQRPEGEHSLTRTEWLLYNILDLRFVKGNKVREVTPRLVMSDSDFYRKQRVAIENVARAIAEMEAERLH